MNARLLPCELTGQLDGLLIGPSFKPVHTIHTLKNWARLDLFETGFDIADNEEIMHVGFHNSGMGFNR